jgi:Tfp pilus assembly protein PilW
MKNQRGLTLIELVIAMAMAVLVMGMVFGIHYQTSQALRATAKFGEHTDGLIAARELIASDARMAGSYLPTQGLRVSTAFGGANAPNFVNFVQCQPGYASNAFTSACEATGAQIYKILPSVSVRNGDRLGADPNADQMMIIRGTGEPITGYPTTSTVQPLVFVANDLPMLNYYFNDNNPNPSNRYNNQGMFAVVKDDGDIGCLIKASSVSTTANALTLVTQPPGYVATNARSLLLDAAAIENTGMTSAVCPWTQPTVRVVPVEVTTYYLSGANERYLARSSTWAQAKTGAGDVIGADFTNLQFAVQFYESSDATQNADASADGDTRHDWYSANQQVGATNNTLTNIRQTVGGTGRPADGVPVAVGITVERRTPKVSQIRTDVSPVLARVGAANAPGQYFNNPYGDATPFDLTVVNAPLRYISERGISNYLDQDNNGVNDGVPYVYQVSSTVIAMRNAGGAL